MTTDLPRPASLCCRLSLPHSARLWKWLHPSSLRHKAGSIPTQFLLMLREYELFVDSFQFACKNFKDNAENAALARTMGFESNKEYNEIMFLREITHTVNMFNDMGDIVRLYSKNPETATVRLANLLSMVSGEESESV